MYGGTSKTNTQETGIHRLLETARNYANVLPPILFGHGLMKFA